MAAPLRVFLIGVSHRDLESLRTRVGHDTSLRIAGAALARDVDEGRNRVPADVDAVLLTPEAARNAGVTGRDADAAEHADAELFEALTPRELDVLALLADGLGNREIAGELGISEHTVKFHLASIYGKLGASTRTEAVRRGLQLGLIEI